MTKKAINKSLKSVISVPDPHHSDCPVTFCLKILGGRWKPLLIFLIENDVNRFGALQRAIPDISKQMLTSQLRQLEHDTIITRTVFPVVPPRVDYRLSDFGRTLLPVIHQMKTWGEAALKSRKRHLKNTTQRGS